MTEFILRLKGKQGQIVDEFVKEGIFSNKTEVVRAGILELYTKYRHMFNEDNEMMLKIAKNIDKEKNKNYSEEEFLAMHPELKE